MIEAVTITINPVNDAPVISDVIVNTDEDVIYTFTAADFTGNFTDVDNDTLATIKVTSLPSASA